MPQDNLILSIDQGTTSTRAILFSGDGRILTQASRPLTQHYPQDGWVEHDAMDIWQDVLAAGREVLVGQDLGRVAALGITNQRETCLIWDRKTGAPLHRAIVWQDRRTAEACAKLKAGGQERMITERTG
ncbi:MAG TPA: glycerol kinase, partial [Alphaproteobacteria bacterium]|nr:glycerol kinase [Alphaproteobacteria bacterium]